MGGGGVSWGDGAAETGGVSASRGMEAIPATTAVLRRRLVTIWVLLLVGVRSGGRRCGVIACNGLRPHPRDRPLSARSRHTNRRRPRGRRRSGREGASSACPQGRRRCGTAEPPVAASLVRHVRKRAQ